MQFLETYNIITMDRIAIYTCITGDYDRLFDVSTVSDYDRYDWICFTDNKDIKANGWTILPIPDDLLKNSFLSNVKIQRLIKICPHTYLSDYNYTMWIDANIRIISDVSSIFADYGLDGDIQFWTRKHPIRTCLYDEAVACIKLNKDKPDIINNQVNGYKKENFPKKYGLYETGIIIRKKCKHVICHANIWAAELLVKSHRDQLSLTYAKWKTGLTIGEMDKDKSLRCGKRFKCNYTHG